MNPVGENGLGNKRLLENRYLLGEIRQHLVGVLEPSQHFLHLVEITKKVTLGQVGIHIVLGVHLSSPRSSGTKNITRLHETIKRFRRDCATLTLPSTLQGEGGL